MKNFRKWIPKSLSDEPELGRVIAMRKHIYVDKLNVRKMVDDFGYLILKNVVKIRGTYTLYSWAISSFERMERSQQSD